MVLAGEGEGRVVLFLLANGGDVSGGPGWRRRGACQVVLAHGGGGVSGGPGWQRRGACRVVLAGEGGGRFWWAWLANEMYVSDGPDVREKETEG